MSEPNEKTTFFDIVELLTDGAESIEIKKNNVYPFLEFVVKGTHLKSGTNIALGKIVPPEYQEDGLKRLICEQIKFIKKIAAMQSDTCLENANNEIEKALLGKNV